MPILPNRLQSFIIDGFFVCACGERLLLFLVVINFFHVYIQSVKKFN